MRSFVCPRRDLPLIGTDERRRRLAARHHLAPDRAAPDLPGLARDLVGIHATDPASVYLGALARLPALTPADVSRALYDDRTVLKVLGMRRTMFVVPRDLAAVIGGAVTPTIAATERKRTLQMLADAGVAERPVEWLSEVETETAATLERMGEATAVELTRAVPRLGTQIAFGAGKKWAGTVGVSTRLLFLLSAEGRVIRGRPRGTWLSSMYAWAPMDRWLGDQLPQWRPEDARTELVRRWLASFGPGTLRDVQWWTGWTLGAARAALAAAGAVDVDLDDGRGLALPGDLDETADSAPWVALLPALDTSTMGWADRAWYLDAHGRRLFDRNGNAGPTVWLDGRVIGGWAQRTTGEVVFSLLEDVGGERRREIEQAAARVQAWLGESRVIPRFRTPLERELSA